MHISNIRRINRAKWRFGGGYLTTFALITAAIYFSFRSPFLDNKMTEQMIERDLHWQEMANVSKKLCMMYDLQKNKSSFSSEDLKQIDAMDNQVMQSLKSIKNGMKNTEDFPFHVYNSLQVFRNSLEDTRVNKNSQTGEIADKYRSEIHSTQQQNADLNRQLMDATRTISQLRSLGNSIR